MTFAERLRVCHKCEHRHRPCRGPCPCLIDGKDIIEHARAGECPKGKYTEPIQPGLVAKVAHGAAGIAAAVAGVDKASDEEIERRQAICKGCEFAVKVLGVFKKCGKCGCVIKAKIRLASEHCPLEKPKW